MGACDFPDTYAQASDIYAYPDKSLTPMLQLLHVHVHVYIHYMYVYTRM